MDIAYRERLWLLLILIPLAFLVWRGRRRRRRDWETLKGSGKPPGDGAWGWTIAAGLLIVALAQPRWGRIGAERPPGHDVVILVDTSRSMGVEDAVPNRLGLAVSAAEGVVQALGKDAGNRVAVVAFASRGVIRCPLTENLGAAVDALRGLKPGDVAPGGTDLGAGLDAASEAFDAEDHDEGRTILVFSDGEDHAGAWSEAASKLEAEKVSVHAVIVGDPTKGREVPSGQGGKSLLYHGEPAVSTRSDAALAEVTKRTGGVLVPLGLAKGDAIGALFRDKIGPAVRRRRESREPPERIERFPLFVAGALVSGVLGSWKFGRRRSILLAALIVGLGASPGEETAGEAVASGNAAYRRGDLTAALAAFERASALDPRSAVSRYDAAATLLRLGRAGEAIERYRSARERADPGLKTKIDFALGNAELARGDVEAAIRDYDECLASKVPGLVYDAVRRDAAENRRFAILHRRKRQADPEGNSGREPPPPASKDRPKPEEKGQEPRKPKGKSDSGSSSDSPDPAPPGSNKSAGSEDPGESDSPRSRLEKALKDVRDARDRRIPDAPPPPTGDGDRKDW